MKTGKWILVSFSFVILAGCVFRGDGGGRSYDRDRGEYYQEGGGGERERHER